MLLEVQWLPHQSMSVVEESESVSKSVTSGSHSEVSSLIGTTQQGKGAAAAPVAAKLKGIAGNVVVVGILEEETLRGDAGSGQLSW